MVMKKIRRFLHSVREDGADMAGASFTHTTLGRMLGPKTQRLVEKVESYTGILLGSGFILTGAMAVTHGITGLATSFLPTLAESMGTYGVAGGLGTALSYALATGITASVAAFMTSTGVGVLSKSAERYNRVTNELAGMTSRPAVKKTAVESVVPPVKDEIPSIPPFPALDFDQVAKRPSEALMKAMELPNIGDDPTPAPDMDYYASRLRQNGMTPSK